MDYLSGHVLTLANSIIGVSILAMPYCFKQCGIILSILILLISSIISRLSCHFLLKSAIIARRKTFEFLAFQIFGSLGKFCIEVGMIGFLIGTCIAFFVVMGDLGPEILSEITGTRTGPALRNSVLVALAVLCVLPLGLLKNVDSLNGVSKATIGFYCCLVLKIILEALPHIFTGDWVDDVILWRPRGILQCLPIFSMALFCQTQLFEIYQALPNASLEKMNGLIRVAVNICTWVYIFVGAFGYIAFFQKPFSGNILLSFRPSVVTDIMKIGFVLSLAFSFPLVIFPCRASLYSLLYKGPNYTSLHEGTASNHIPEGKFKLLTLIIVTVSLVIGILIPNIELVLGLVGSTIGVMICVLFPVTCFICISPKNTNERILAQIMLFVGIIVMVLGTYANLYAFEEAKLAIVTENNAVKAEPVKENINDRMHEILLSPNENVVLMEVPTTVKKLLENQLPLEENLKVEENLKEVRHEPPQPEEPVEIQVTAKPEKGPDVNQEATKDEKHSSKEKVASKIADEIKFNQEPVIEPIVPLQESIEKKKISEVLKEYPADQGKNEGNNEIKNVEKKEQDASQIINDVNVKKNDDVDIEAIKKEDTELKEQEKEDVQQVQNQNQILIDTIQKQNEVQKEIVEQQKKLIEVIQKQQESQNQDIEKVVNEEKVKAVKQIEDIAKKAIESISNPDNKNIIAELENNKVHSNNDINGQLAVKSESEGNVSINHMKMPLSYQLALNQEKKNEVSVDDAKMKLVPLPIAFANANINNSANVENKKPVKTESVDNLKKNQTDDESLKTIRRDILSNNENSARIKREVGTEKTDEVKQLNDAVKEVCAQMNKPSSTEKPLIKMLCKLSEPNVVQVDITALRGDQAILHKNQNDADVKQPGEM